MDVDLTLSQLVEVGIALSSETDTTKLLEKILLAAQKMSNADGGTIYSVTDDDHLMFDTMFNDSLNLYLGGSSGKPITFAPIPIRINDEINHSALVARAAGFREVINIEDVYTVTEYDMSGAKKMDLQTGYHSQSELTIPMTNHEGELNGVLQLINAQQGEQVIPFSQEIEKSIRALASLAAVALTNRELINNMEELFQSFTRLIAKAIDEKSPYTGGHCRRVPELTMMIAEAVHQHNSGPLADFQMNDGDRHELSLAGWLHDCGKIGTPEYIMDKSKKLETVFDRIELVEARFEVACQSIQINYLKQKANTAIHQHHSLDGAMNQEIQALQEDLAFIKNANTGGEFMNESDQERVKTIGTSRTIMVNGSEMNLLTDEEIYNLQTARGTLNKEEREIINRHMDITLEMLDSLPFPKHLRRVPEFAGGHHEKMDGTGYPKGLTKEQMSVPARIMAIADIFEALTASDRPYKPAKKISECLKIMGRMALDKHIDEDLFNIFIEKQVYRQYADVFLSKEQLDPVLLNELPGYQAG